jgi:hypothetical protein
MLCPLDHPDRVLWAVERRTAGVVLLVGRHEAVAQHLSVALLVVDEQRRGEVIAASVTLTETGIDLDFHQEPSSMLRRMQEQELRRNEQGNGSLS